MLRVIRRTVYFPDFKRCLVFFMESYMYLKTVVAFKAFNILSGQKMHLTSIAWDMVETEIFVGIA